MTPQIPKKMKEMIDKQCNQILQIFATLAKKEQSLAIF